MILVNKERKKLSSPQFYNIFSHEPLDNISGYSKILLDYLDHSNNCKLYLNLFKQEVNWKKLKISCNDEVTCSAENCIKAKMFF